MKSMKILLPLLLLLSLAVLSQAHEIRLPGDDIIEEAVQLFDSAPNVDTPIFQIGSLIAWIPDAENSTTGNSSNIEPVQGTVW